MARAHELHLAKDAAWTRLLHLRRDVLGRRQSEVDDARFFLAPNGRRDPAAELEATLRAFAVATSTTSDADEQPAWCRFPARYAWLKDRLNTPETSLPEVTCPRFEKWANAMKAESVTVIFASYYMNNPASMYGHTFLRLNGQGHGSAQRLLDYTANYAADTTTNNGILFAVLGLTGGYRGRFSTMPYYVKVQEYNNLESRDLWEYDLALSSSAVRRLVQHLWELGGSGTMPYYFLNRNCSYQLMPLLEVAEPGLSLSRPFKFRTIPADTLRVLLAQPGLVGDVRLRPSHVSRLLGERARLDGAEATAARGLALTPHPAQHESLVAEMPPERRALVLDTAYDFFRYRSGFRRPQPQDVQVRERELLLLRNKTGTVDASSATVIPETAWGRGASPFPPHLGHRTGRISLGYGFNRRSHYEEISVRPAVHDLEDSPEGYTPGSQLQMLYSRWRYDHDRGRLYPQQVTLLDLVSYQPWDPWVHHPAWKVNTGFAVAQDLPRDPEHALFYGVHGGSGLALPIPGTRNTMVYGLILADAGLGAPFRDWYRFGGGALAGVTGGLGGWYRVRFEAEHLQYAVGHPGPATTLRLSQGGRLTKATGWRVLLERHNHNREATFSLLGYW